MMILFCPSPRPRFPSQRMFISILPCVSLIVRLRLLTEINEQIVQLFIFACLHLNSQPIKQLIMSLGNISLIKIPQGRKVRLEEAVLMKIVDKQKTFCEVKLIKYEDQPYALKIIHKKQIPPSRYEEQYHRLSNQINALYTLNHPNIIKLYYHEETQDDITMLQEYGGTRLWGLLRRQKLTEERAKELVEQILTGLKEIHDNGYVHRDLSTINILVYKQKQIKIIDLGYIDKARGRHTKLGDLFYMAPEITGDTTYNQKVDIWSLGIVVYEMFHQDIPFCSSKDFNQQLFQNNRSKLHLQLREDLSPEAIDFMKKTIVLDPQKRPNVDDLLVHPFIKPVREQSQQHSESSFFDRLNETQKIQRKTQKNNPYARQKSQRQSQKNIAQSQRVHHLQKQLKKSIGEVFACMHHQKDIFSDLIKSYQDLLQKQTMNRVKKG